jgi:hypothetical protein
MGKHLGKQWGNILPLKPFKTIKNHFSAFPPKSPKTPVFIGILASSKAVPAHRPCDSVGT